MAQNLHMPLIAWRDGMRVTINLPIVATLLGFEKEDGMEQKREVEETRVSLPLLHLHFHLHLILFSNLKEIFRAT